MSVRSAISPAIATVLIVAATLVAGVAVSGYVFGVLGLATNAAQVAVTQTSLRVADFKAANSGTTFTCGSPSGSWISISNTGASTTSVTGVTITFAGGSNTFSVSGACAVGAAGSGGAIQSLLFTNEKLTVDPISGATYSGTVSLASGVQLSLIGQFQ